MLYIRQHFTLYQMFVDALCNNSLHYFTCNAGQWYWPVVSTLPAAPFLNTDTIVAFVHSWGTLPTDIYITFFGNADVDAIRQPHFAWTATEKN